MARVRKTTDVALNFLRGLQRCASGKREEAEKVLQQIDEPGGSFSEACVRETYPFVRSQDYVFFIEGLRKAGWKG